jgi:hypothetical protein
MPNHVQPKYFARARATVSCLATGPSSTNAPRGFWTRTRTHTHSARLPLRRKPRADTHVKTSACPLSSSFGLAPPVASTPRTRGCDATDLGDAGLGLFREPPRLLRHWQKAPDTHVSACLPSIQAHRALSTQREEESARDHASAHCHRHAGQSCMAVCRCCGGGGRRWRQRRQE